MEVTGLRRFRAGDGSSGPTSSFHATRLGVACDNRRSRSRARPCRRSSRAPGGMRGTRPRTRGCRLMSWREGHGTSSTTGPPDSSGNRRIASSPPAGSGRAERSRAGSSRGRRFRAGGGRTRTDGSPRRPSGCRVRTASRKYPPRPCAGPTRYGTARGRGSARSRCWGSSRSRRARAARGLTWWSCGTRST